jgi:Holliday junction resolvase RusA-like endonuclease
MTVLFRGRLPLPPGINASYKIVRIRRAGGREYQRLGETPELRQFKKDAALELSQTKVDVTLWEQIRHALPRKTPLQGEITFFFETMWRRDVDGGIKHTIDAVFAHLILNDNLLVDLHVRKLVDKNDPHTDVEISLLKDEPLWQQS